MAEESALELHSLLDANEKEGNTDKKSPTNWEKLKGSASVLVSVLMEVISATCVQLLRRSIPDMELNTMRFATAFILISTIFLLQRKLPKVPILEIPYVLCFTVLLVVNTIGLFIPVTYLSLTTAESVSITSLIISGMFLYWTFWDDQITLKAALFAALCVIGVTLVIQPKVLFTGKHNHLNSTQNSTTENTPYIENSTTATAFLGYGLAVLYGTACSLAGLLIKRRPYFTDHITQVIFWAFMLGTIISAVVMVTFEKVRFPDNGYQWFLIILHCLPFVLPWPFVMYALQYISGNTVNILYSTIVIMMLIPQYTLLSTILPGNRNWIEVVGVVLVLIGSSLGSVWELLKSK